MAGAARRSPREGGDAVSRAVSWRVPTAPEEHDLPNGVDPRNAIAAQIGDICDALLAEAPEGEIIVTYADGIECKARVSFRFCVDIDVSMDTGGTPQGPKVTRLLDDDEDDLDAVARMGF